MPLAILVRTDLIFLVALFLAYLFLFEKTQKIEAAVAFVASLALYLFVNDLFGNYGWSTVFYLVFVSDFTLNYPADKEIHIELAQYLRAVFKGTVQMFESDKFNAFIGIALLHAGILLKLKQPGNSLRNYMSQRINTLAAISLIYVIVHFLIFPAGYSRFFTAQYLTGLLALLSIMTRISGLHPHTEQDAVSASEV